MSTMEMPATPQDTQTQVLIYHQGGLITQALRAAIAKRAPELALTRLPEASHEDLQASLMIITIPTNESVDVDDLLKPFEPIRSKRPKTPVVAFMHAENATTAMQLLDRNVAAIISADNSIEATIAALRFALAGGHFAPPGLLREENPKKASVAPPQTMRAETLELTSQHETSFTPREVEVLHRLRQGLQNKIIAYELGISESTVKVHLRNVMKKLHASNRTQVAFMLRRLPHLHSTATAGRDYPPQ